MTKTPMMIFQMITDYLEALVPANREGTHCTILRDAPIDDDEN